MTARRLYSVEEAVDSLSLSRTKLYELFGSGQLGSVHVGRKRLIPADELDRYVERLKADHAAA